MAEAAHNFPADFLWGTATAAHQVEGGNDNNDWWQWEQAGQRDSSIGRRIYQDQTSGKAADWWEGRAEEDIARMKALNNNAHRLSIEWSRIEPEPGVWNHEALDRYRAILRAMRAAGIEPMVTLHHFTNPIWLAEKGGWRNEDVVEHFRRFVEKAVGDLSDLCDTWCTINEPNVYAAQSYFIGKWPPGHQSISEYFQVCYHMMLAHAAAYSVIHDIQAMAKVGFAKHMVSFYPRHARNPLDVRISRLIDSAFNGLTLDTLATGVFKPAIGRKIEVPQVKGTLDWIGLNYYTRNDAFFNLRLLNKLGIDYAPRRDKQQGPSGWGEIYPEGLFENIGRLYRQFKLPIYITENGMPDERDENRPAFLLRHLRQVWRAVMWNWPVKGYYFWSLVDNFEWAEGYDPRYRFGLYTVDFKTQERTLTRSGQLYAEMARNKALTSDMTRRYAPEIFDELFPGTGPDDMFRVA
jgi:beta-glucosidase